MKFIGCKWLHLGIAYLILSSLFPQPLVLAKLSDGEQLPAKQCPTDVTTLTNLLLRDLPDYSNRVIQRTQKLHRGREIYRYIITTGKSEFKPLNLPQIQYQPTKEPAVEQVFFTVFEREYRNNQKTEIQTYHWLFLTPTSDGWHLVTMFSRFGDSTVNNPPTPPQETSNGIIGRAVQLWLRDCRAGRIDRS